jgi:hypothetical protein
VIHNACAVPYRVVRGNKQPAQEHWRSVVRQAALSDQQRLQLSILWDVLETARKTLAARRGALVRVLCEPHAPIQPSHPTPLPPAVSLAAAHRPQAAMLGSGSGTSSQAVAATTPTNSLWVLPGGGASGVQSMSVMPHPSHASSGAVNPSGGPAGTAKASDPRFTVLYKSADRLQVEEQALGYLQSTIVRER